MKNVIAILTIVFLANCQLQKQTSKSAATSAATASQSEVWYGSFSGSDCLEDFIDQLDPKGSANYVCKPYTKLSKTAFNCVPTNVAESAYYDEVDRGQKILNTDYGWYEGISGSGSTYSAYRVQWNTSGYPGVKGFILMVLDYPKMDMKICSNRWN